MKEPGRRAEKSEFCHALLRSLNRARGNRRSGIYPLTIQTDVMVANKGKATFAAAFPGSIARPILLCMGLFSRFHI
jgi:hypothetical protein